LTHGNVSEPEATPRSDGQEMEAGTSSDEPNTHAASRHPRLPGVSEGLIRGAGFALVLQVLGVALTYLLHVTLARWLGAAGYGVYAYILSWATVLATVGALGLPLASLRFVSQHFAAQRWAELRGVLFGAPALVMLGSMAVFSLGAVGAMSASADPLPWILGFACVPLLAQLALGTEIARAIGSIGASLVPGRVLRPLFTLFLISVIWAQTTEPLAAVAATVVALTVVIMVQGTWLYRLIPMEGRAARPVYKPRLWLRAAFPMMVATGTALFLTQLDLLMVGLLLDEHSTGLYSAAAKTAAILPLVLYAFNVAAAPSFAALHERGDTRQLQELASRVARWAFWPSLGVAVGLSVSAGWILGWFGAPFVAARGAVVLLTAAYLFSAGVGSVGYLLNLTGHEHHNARTLLWAAVIDVALNLALIPTMGILGAALATALTWVFVGLRLHHLTRRHVGVRASVLSAFN
jgi:O-antigen/teichoic acid export membrane protein